MVFSEPQEVLSWIRIIHIRSCMYACVSEFVCVRAHVCMNVCFVGFEKTWTQKTLTSDYKFMDDSLDK